jgi:16S rRNA (uracil1498-N3)-methyltransferase
VTTGPRSTRPRLFVEVDPETPDTAHLDPQASTHLRALRLDVGSEITAIVGPGRERVATVVAVEKRAAKLRLGSELPAVAADPRESLVLAIALADLGRMDLVIEKATELGATAVWPFVAERSQMRDLSAARVDRWLRVGRAACEQCGRTVPPEIASLLPFAALATRVASSRSIVLHPDAHASPPPRLEDDRETIVVVGPEGGLTSEETSELQRRGAVLCSLGPRILRFETAAIAALVWVAASRARRG